MSRPRSLAALTILLLLIAAPVALATDGGYGNDPCDEYHETRHPECQTTTTTWQTTTSQGSTTTSDVTTTTEVEVTTTTPNETTTTAAQTTTTLQQCADGLIHQPPLCVDPSTTTVPVFDTTTTTTVELAVLPFTGLSSSVLALAASLSLAGGLVLLAVRRRVEG